MDLSPPAYCLPPTLAPPTLALPSFLLRARLLPLVLCPLVLSSSLLIVPVVPRVLFVRPVKAVPAPDVVGRPLSRLCWERLWRTDEISTMLLTEGVWSRLRGLERDLRCGPVIVFSPPHHPPTLQGTKSAFPTRFCTTLSREGNEGNWSWPDLEGRMDLRAFAFLKRFTSRDGSQAALLGPRAYVRRTLRSSPFALYAWYFFQNPVG